MKPISKFFTPPLTQPERRMICRALGFGELRFTFLEKCGALNLRVRSYIGPDGTSHLSAPPTLFEEGFPQLTHKRESLLPSEAADETLSLWEELFPYPVGLIGKLFRRPTDSTLDLSPAPLKAALRLLWQTLEQLDARMAATEASCLWLEGASEPSPCPPLLLQYVRKRRVRVGTAPNLVGLGERFREGALTQNELIDTFGTHSSFFYLSLEGLGSGFDRIPAVTDRILRLLASPESGDSTPVGPVLTAHIHPRSADTAALSGALD